MKSIRICRYSTAVVIISLFLQLHGGLLKAAELTLGDCLTTGLASSPDIKAASSRLVAAKAGVKSAESAYYPWVTVSSMLARTDNPPQAFMMSLNQKILNMADPAFDPNNPDDTDNLRVSLGLQYRLLDGGRRSLDRGMANLGASAAGEGLEAVRNELLHMITKTYYGSVKARTFINVQEESVKSVEESLRVARERQKAGAALETDVLNLEVQLSQAKEDLVRARNGFLMAIAALNAAVGKDVATAENILTYHAALPEAACALIPASAAENRAEFKAMKIAAEIRGKALAKAKKEYFPTVNIFASSDWDSDVSSEFEQSYMAGVMVDLNIFDGFRSRNAVGEAKARAQAAVADQEKVLNNLKLDAIQACIEMKEARERVEVTGKGAVSAEQALKVTRDRYQHGATGVAELITAQTALTAMKARDTAARFDYLTAISNLERAEGKLSSKFNK
ncbi:MAG: TolC family protein [Kiritimatiellae bacterium]|nr:TolC family protein [Kiritimatiellia bacterium]MDD5522468.1 TolC family protein [Kiritimatiellia bacterium]